MEFSKKAISKESSLFIDLVRLTACELVVLGYAFVYYPISQGGSLSQIGYVLAGTGVLMFFAISGLLISYSVFNKSANPDYRFRNYFIDRFSRIYSGLLPGLLLVTILDGLILVTNHSYFNSLVVTRSMPKPYNFAINLTMLERFPVDFYNSILSSFTRLRLPFSNVEPYGFDGPLFTLVIEWWLYMAFGWIVLGIISRKKEHTATRRAVRNVIFIVVTLLLSSIVLAMYQIKDEHPALIAIWFIGVLLMLMISNKRLTSKLSKTRGLRLLSLLFILSFAGLVYEMLNIFIVTHSYYDIALGLLLATCILSGVLLLNGGGTRSPPWTLIFRKRITGVIITGALYSYTLYLIHFPIILFLNGLTLPINKWLMIGVILLSTNFIAYPFARLTEMKHKGLAKTIKLRLHISE